MPYSLRGNSVIKSSTGEVVKSHPTREKALAHLKALKANVEESAGGVLGVLLEGFAAAPADPFPEHAFTAGDQVRVSVGGGASSVVGKVVRPHGVPKPTHAVIAPDGGGAHVLAPVGQVKLNTPAQHAAAEKRAERQEQKRMQDEATAKWMAGKPPGARVPGVKVREGVELLLEGFKPAVIASVPAGETPGQSASRGAQEVAAAKVELAKGGWNASKHPRAQGGRFGYSTGGKQRTGRRATRGHPGQRTLTTGASGALVKAIQRQLGIKADGQYGPQTSAAVSRYQTQHRLLVDGIVGAQTLNALRGRRPGKPGALASRQARTVKPRARKARAGKSGAPVRLGGGVVV